MALLEAAQTKAGYIAGGREGGEPVGQRARPAGERVLEDPDLERGDAHLGGDVEQPDAHPAAPVLGDDPARDLRQRLRVDEAEPAAPDPARVVELQLGEPGGVPLDQLGDGVGGRLGPGEAGAEPAGGEHLAAQARRVERVVGQPGAHQCRRGHQHRPGTEQVRGRHPVELGPRAPPGVERQAQPVRRHHRCAVRRRPLVGRAQRRRGPEGVLGLDLRLLHDRPGLRGVDGLGLAAGEARGPAAALGERLRDVHPQRGQLTDHADPDDPDPGGDVVGHGPGRLRAAREATRPGRLGRRRELLPRPGRRGRARRALQRPARRALQRRGHRRPGAPGERQLPDGAVQRLAGHPEDPEVRHGLRP